MASRALAAYAELSTKRPYAVAFGSCAVKGVIADTISQRIVEGKQEQNWKRTAVFAFYGGWYCGWFQHALYNVGYARLFGLLTSLKNAVRKVALIPPCTCPWCAFRSTTRTKVLYTTASGCEAAWRDTRTSGR